MKNFFCLNLLSLGVPMLLMGDEVGRTQGGNNNAYCQDNEISWLDWSLCETNTDLLRFVRELIRFRLHQPAEARSRDLSLTDLLEQTPLHWHGVTLDHPDWGPSSRSLAFTIESRRGWLHLIVNAWGKPLDFEIPAHDSGPDGGWKRIIDTTLDAPQDFVDPNVAPAVENGTYRAGPNSVVLLME